MKKSLLCVFLICAGSNVLAQSSQTVYRTVDESGAVSFSDVPPEGSEPAQVLTLDVASPSDPEVYQQNLEAMRETTDRMADDRRAREKHRAEMRELAAREAPNSSQQAPTTLVDQYSTGWYGVAGSGNYHRPGRPPWRPGHRPKPEHPDYRPPVNQLPAYPTQGNSQLMRPILPRGR